jgi:hypothetical protein
MLKRAGHTVPIVIGMVFFVKIYWQDRNTHVSTEQYKNCSCDQFPMGWLEQGTGTGIRASSVCLFVSGYIYFLLVVMETENRLLWLW